MDRIIGEVLHNHEKSESAVQVAIVKREPDGPPGVVLEVGVGRHEMPQTLAEPASLPPSLSVLGPRLDGRNQRVDLGCGPSKGRPDLLLNGSRNPVAVGPE